ncbi:hypothetical protein HYH03_003864 [Edaphochlamys debaryana]|uniref:von Hippel-Lindau disease tumour suppressor beta domain-containing protein n=1 Tax=Edaphochlamys debaryana TaxID=47281 RepID=A0A835Y8S1_9CHLO|nr:hypothetical protein HYH03_003864 [Edaphochlamys debaryana]|eukprot:KAG2498106.1 hypothetical protein HYH03_003864 [Edaphochlamys debaryana]
MAVKGSVSTHEDGKTEACWHRISNKSKRSIRGLWVDFNGDEAEYFQLEAGHATPQMTYTTHLWRLRYKDTGELVGEYAGPSAELEVQPSGGLSVRSWSVASPQPKPEWGEYRKRGSALGIEIWAYDCVLPRAVRIAEQVVGRMLELSPPEVVRRLVAGGAKVAIIGRHQVTTDIPAHSFMRWAEGGRDTDTTTRGLGGTGQNPVTSCGEENLIMQDDKWYTSENILVHEFGHTVMNIGLSAEDRAAIKQLYDAAYRAGLYDREAYIMENEDEYWAEGTQAWFHATIRTDVTGGVTTRDKLKARDPGLAAMMARAYGDGPWRYPHDSPGQFRERSPSRTADPAASSATAPGVSASVFPEEPSSVPTLSAPGVEDGMERSRLAASAAGGGAGGCLGTCMPGASGGRGASPGCGTAVWATLRDAIVGQAAHPMSKLS